MITLTWSQVNAWRLCQHQLLERGPRSKMLDIVKCILGLQAQMMSAAELQVWARVRGVKPEDIRDAIWKDHTLVKTWAMRGTLHLLPAEEYGLYVAALRSRQHWLAPAWLKYFGVTRPQMEALLDGISQALDGRCLTREELADEVARITRTPQFREHLRSGWGSLLKPAAFWGYLCFGPSQGKSVTFVRPDQWIGPWKEINSDLARQELLRRFLTVYGPATRDDFGRWIGVAPSSLRPAFQALDGELEEVKVDDWKGYALASTIDKIKAASEHDTVRLLPNFDVYINLNYSHRSLMLDQAHTARVYRKSAWVSPVLLVNGHMEGVWSYEKKRDKLLVSVEPFSSLSKVAKQGIEQEAVSLGDFLGAPAEVTYTGG